MSALKDEEHEIGMGNHHPPSPPLSDGIELQYGLHHLQQHNAAMQYQPNSYGTENGVYLPSRARTEHSTPEPRQLLVDEHAANPYHPGFSSQHDSHIRVPYVRTNFIMVNCE